MKGILSAATVGDRVGERPDHFVKFHERSGPAMTEYQWQGIGVLRSLVNKVNVEAVDVGFELLELIEPALLRTPIESVAPIPD